MNLLKSKLENRNFTSDSIAMIKEVAMVSITAPYRHLTEGILDKETKCIIIIYCF
jgi:hypothetical protein